MNAWDLKKLVADLPHGVLPILQYDGVGWYDNYSEIYVGDILATLAFEAALYKWLTNRQTTIISGDMVQIGYYDVPIREWTRFQGECLVDSLMQACKYVLAKEHQKDETW